MMRPFRLAALALALTLPAAPIPVRAQAPTQPAPATTSTETTSTAQPISAATQPSANGALPADQEPAPPRTLRAYTHVWIAFTLVWVAMFGYALSLGRRFRRLEAEVDSLRAAS